MFGFGKNKKYEQACNQVHGIILELTRELSPEKINDNRIARKKMSAFTFGLCTAIAKEKSLDAPELYYRYLLKGGLNRHSARVVVERTSLEFIKRDFGQMCFDAGAQSYEDPINAAPVALKSLLDV